MCLFSWYILRDVERYSLGVRSYRGIVRDGTGMRLADVQAYFEGLGDMLPSGFTSPLGIME